MIVGLLMTPFDQMKKLEIALLCIAIVGAPFIEFILTDSQPYDPDTASSSIIYKKGDKLTLTIHSYQLNYLINGSELENYDFKFGIFLNYHSVRDYNDAMMFLNETTIQNLVLSIQIMEASRTYALAYVKETGLTFHIQLYGISSHDSAAPRFAPGIKVSDKNNVSNVFIAWYTVPVFPTDLSKVALEHNARSGAINSWEKIGADTFHFPRDELGGFSDPPRADRTWIFYAWTTKLKRIIAFREDSYVWTAERHAWDGFPEGITIQANMSLDLEWKYN